MLSMEVPHGPIIRPTDVDRDFGGKCDSRLLPVFGRALNAGLQVWLEIIELGDFGFYARDTTLPWPKGRKNKNSEYKTKTLMTSGI